MLPDLPYKPLAFRFQPAAESVPLAGHIRKPRTYRSQAISLAAGELQLCFPWIIPHGRTSAKHSLFGTIQRSS